jgi:hypothetical protein
VSLVTFAPGTTADQLIQLVLLAVNDQRCFPAVLLANDMRSLQIVVYSATPWVPLSHWHVESAKSCLSRVWRKSHAKASGAI